MRFNSLVAGLVQTNLSSEIRRSIGEESWASLVDSHPLGIGRPTDVAHAAVFLLSFKSSWITGAELVVDGGYLA